MNTMKFRHMLVAATLAIAAVPASAEVVVGVGAKCATAGPAFPICAGAAVVLHEAAKLGNGEKPFGPNGEGIRLLRAPVSIVDGNVRGAARERGELDKVFKGTTGISIRDIRRYGIFGGPNSVFRKPFG